MSDTQKICFVVQGFGEKTDFRTGRKLDLDASYEVIKEAVENAGLKCIRTDEIQHFQIIDKPMNPCILNADLSTSNNNAAYELGVRHALCRRSTINMAEKQWDFPFDINHSAIRTYEHLGSDISRKEAGHWSLLANDAWVLGAIHARTEFHFASPLRWENLKFPEILYRDSGGGQKIKLISSVMPIASRYSGRN